jgi:hypothetical protein
VTNTDDSVVVLLDGAVRLLFRDLPDPAVCALLPDLGDGVLRIVVDTRRPDAMVLGLLMLHDCCDEPISLDQLVDSSRPRLN